MTTPLPSFTSSEMLSTERLLEFLRTMWMIRRLEERVAQLYTLGKIGGFCHLYIGQEAIAVAASRAMSAVDSMITSYRCHGHMVARGASQRSILGELLGKTSGCSRGKGGSMHMFHPEQKFYGGHGIVGAQTALGTGLAFAHQYRQDGGVCLAFMGDGATNQGQFFESMNMASLWNLPVLYIIENNHYSMGTSVQRGCAGGSLYHRGEPFGIAGYQIEGHDVQAVYGVISGALEKVRQEKRPLVLEISTHRFRGHSVSDPGKYRTREEVEEAKASKDPIQNLYGVLLGKGCSEEELERLNTEIKEELQEILKQVEADPELGPEEMYTDVLRKGTEAA